MLYDQQTSHGDKNNLKILWWNKRFGLYQGVRILLCYISSEFSGYLVTTHLFFYNNLVVCRWNHFQHVLKFWKQLIERKSHKHIKRSKLMPNSYQPNDKSPASVQPVYVATCITHGFFQNLWRTIGDAIFVHIVTSSVYITSMLVIVLSFLLSG